MGKDQKLVPTPITIGVINPLAVTFTKYKLLWLSIVAGLSAVVYSVSTAVVKFLEIIETWHVRTVMPVKGPHPCDTLAAATACAAWKLGALAASDAAFLTANANRASR